MLNKICPRGRHRPGQTSCAAPSRPSSLRGHRRQACRRFERGPASTDEPDGRRWSRDRRHDRLRRHRRRQARQPRILTGMEMALQQDRHGPTSRYGLDHAQAGLYSIGRPQYTGPDRARAQLPGPGRGGVGGWLLTPFLQKIGPGPEQGCGLAARPRVVKGLKDDVREPLHAGDLASPRCSISRNIAIYNKARDPARSF